MSKITICLLPLNACLLPADFLHPVSFCSFPFLVFRRRVSPSHIPFRVFWRDFPGRSAPSLISAYPPNYLLLHSVTRWPSSFQKFQFNTSTILLFTGNVTSFRLLSLGGNRSTNHLSTQNDDYDTSILGGRPSNTSKHHHNCALTG